MCSEDGARFLKHILQTREGRACSPIFSPKQKLHPRSMDAFTDKNGPISSVAVFDVSL